MRKGFEGLLHDKTSPGAFRHSERTLRHRWSPSRRRSASRGATHWTATMMAKEAGISASSVQRIWRAHGLQPRRIWQFKKLSNDPNFVEKLHDWWDFISIRLTMPSCFRSTRRAKSRRSTAPNRGCPSRRGALPPYPRL